MFASLHSELPWTQHVVKMFGRSLPTPRMVSWHGDADTSYRYSGVRHLPQPWTADLLCLRDRVSQFLQHPFNSVLVNLYRDGRDSMGWHSDDEPELGLQPMIASISLGGPRRMGLRSRCQPPQRTGRVLEHGSLLVMEGNSQRDWQHQIAKTRQPCAERINLTFRLIRH